MKILFVVNNPDFFLSHRLPIAKAAKKAGYEVHVATPAFGDMERIRRHGFEFHAIPLDRSKGRPWKEAASFWAIYSLYRRLKPDLVHHVTIKPVIYGSIAAKMAKVPCVLNAVPGLGYVFIATGVKGALIRRLVLQAYRIAFSHPNQKIVFQNPDDVRVFMDRGIITHHDLVIIPGSGADGSEFSPLPEPSGPPIVLFPARMLWDKGLREFVKTAALLKERGIAARFVLAGEVDPGNPASATIAWLRQAETDTTVEWWGKCDNMPDVINRSTIVCLPSYREGLPKSLIEAAACGRAMVSTNAPGCRDIVRSGDNGLLVPVRDAEALASAIESLLSDPELRKRMGRRSREIFESEYSIEKVITETLANYRELMKGDVGTAGFPLAGEMQRLSQGVRN